jgi:hypothetical protein
MQTMRCLSCETVLFLGGDACPRCGGKDAVPFSDPRQTSRERHDPGKAAGRATLPAPASEPAEPQHRAAN